MKTPVPVSFLIKFIEKFIKKETLGQVPETLAPVYFAKFLRTFFRTEHIPWLLPFILKDLGLAMITTLFPSQ